MGVFVAATKFCAEYFDQQKGDSHPALSVLRQLKSASEQLTLEVCVPPVSFKQLREGRVPSKGQARARG